jgi:Putative zinc-finger
MTDGHLDATMLADYDEGLLSPFRNAEIEDHLAGCPSCSAVLGQLGQVRARLDEAPTGITMPPAVAARIERALTAEQARRDHEGASAQRATIRYFRRRLPTLLAAAATVAAVGFGGYVVVSSGGGDEDTTTSAERAAADANAGRDDSGIAGGVDEDAAGGDRADQEVAPVPAERSILTDQILAIAAAADLASGEAAMRQQLAENCGLALARALDTELIGAASTDVGEPGSVLVVVEGQQPDQARGVVLPGCDAGPAEALQDLTVPTE